MKGGDIMETAINAIIYVAQHTTIALVSTIATAIAYKIAKGR